MKKIRTAVMFVPAALALLCFPPACFAQAPEIEMVSVKGGCFQMGDVFDDGFADESPVHEVCVGDFRIGKYEVTLAEWKAVMGSAPGKLTGDRRPVAVVSWNEAQLFIQALNQTTGKSYRLPTEAEWEYAARSGGKKEKWSGTSDSKKVGDYAWYALNSGKKKTTQDVGAKKPNGLGIYDMSGNVWEMIQDRYDHLWYERSTKDNPQGPPEGRSRALRGGSFANEAKSVRAMERSGNDPNGRDEGVGFRLAAPAK